MRVPTQSASESVINQIQDLTARQTLLQKQISTGQRIFLPEDDPAAVGRVLAWDHESRRVQQYKNNAGTALDVAQSTYVGLDSLSSLASRATELSTLGISTNSDATNKTYATEMNQLIEQAVQTANSKFGGAYLFAGTAVDSPPFTITRDAAGQITGVAYAGNTSQASVALSETATLAPGSSGTTNTGIGDFINQMVALRDAFNTSDNAGIAAASQPLATSHDLISDAIAENGAVQQRIQSTQDQLASRLENVGQLASDETSIDMSATLVKFNQSTTAYEAALSSATKILQTSLLDYLH